jgi:hypothetical protein
MSLRGMASADVDSVFFESGGWKETVSYLPVGQTSGETSVSAIVEDIQDPMGGAEKGFDAELVPNLVNAALIYVSETEIAAPAYGDQFTQGTQVWRVRQISKQEGMYVLACVGDERMSL